jgi:hypothetical protein
MAFFGCHGRDGLGVQVVFCASSFKGDPNPLTVVLLLVIPSLTDCHFYHSLSGVVVTNLVSVKGGSQPRQGPLVLVYL